MSAMVKNKKIKNRKKKIERKDNLPCLSPLGPSIVSILDRSYLGMRTGTMCFLLPRASRISVLQFLETRYCDSIIYYIHNERFFFFSFSLFAFAGLHLLVRQGIELQQLQP